MQRRFNNKQIKELKQFHKMLVRMANDEFRGAVLSSKQKVLGKIYDQVADNRCSSCNNNWIKRMARWYVKDLEIINLMSKKKNDKRGDKKVL